MKETKELLKFIFSAVMAGEQAAKDGLDWMDAIHFVPVAALLPSAIGGSAHVLAELKVLDEDKKKELKDYIAEELDLEHDKVEFVIEKALNVVIELVEFYNKWSDK